MMLLMKCKWQMELLLILILTHLVFSMSSIMDSEIHMPDLSHFVHASLLDDAQPSDFQDVCLAKSSPFSVFPLTILDPMGFYNSSFVIGTHSESLLEDFEHHYISSLHSSTIEDSLPVYSCSRDFSLLQGQEWLPSVYMTEG